MQTPSPGWAGATDPARRRVPPTWGAGVLGVALAAVALVVTLQANDAPTGSAQVGPSADAYTDTSRPESNFGSSGGLYVDGSPARTAYLRFTNPREETARAAALSLTPESAHDSGFTVRVAEGDWTEDGLALATASVSAGATCGTSGPLSPGKRVTVTLDVARCPVPPGAVITLSLDTASSTNLRLGSRESDEPPALHLSFGASDGTSRRPDPASDLPVTGSPAPGPSNADPSTPGPSTPDPSIPESPKQGAAAPTWSSTGPLQVWAAGDLCDDDGESPGCGDLGALVSSDAEADRMLLLGDIAYESGTREQFREHYDPAMGKGAKLPDGRSLWDVSLAAVGNHEYLTDAAAPYFEYFGPDRAGTPGTGSFFVRDLGRWRVVSLNTNCSHAEGCEQTSPQGRFLASELEAATRAGDHVIVIAHHPPFSDGSNYAPGIDDARPLFEVAVAHGADLWLAGHDHQYQRWGRLAEDGARDRAGLPYWVVGTGGKGNRGFDPTQRSLFRYGEPGTLPGGLRLDLAGTGFSWVFVTTDGTIVDRGTEGVR